jgi:hypothetical protein
MVARLRRYPIIARRHRFPNIAKSGAQSEAQAILDMVHTAALFPASERDRLRGDFVCYGRAVVSEEWPAMRHGNSSPVVDAWIADYRDLFGRLDLRSAREQLAFQNLLTEAGARTDGRRERLSDATPTVPTPLWLALVFGGCLAVVIQFGQADSAERLPVQAAMVTVVAALVAAGLLLVYFLDHPYQGYGSIQPTAMRQTLTMVSQLQPGLRPPCAQDGRR